MKITFPCTRCGITLEIDASGAGNTVECPQCHEPLVVPLAAIGEGTTIGGFRIERLLGKGGMGEVYLAQQMSMDRAVALKILPAELRRDKDLVDQFLQEVRVLAKLDHPHIVAAYEAGDDNGVLYLAMGYVPGASLEARLKQEGRIAWKEACGIVKKLAGALAYAWDEHRMLHRDIKPSNVLFDSRGEPKLVDMGLAKTLTHRREEGQSTAGMILGTPNYMSPEQAEGRDDLDLRADMYSLGATLYHMVTGQIPFRGSSPQETLRKQVSESLPDPRQYTPDLPEGLTALLRIMLAKDRNRRHEKWETLIADLQRVLAGRMPQRAVPISASSAGMIRVRTTAGIGGDTPASATVKPKRSRSAAPWVIVALTVAVALGIWLAVRHGRTAAPTPVAAPTPMAQPMPVAPPAPPVLAAKDPGIAVGKALEDGPPIEAPDAGSVDSDKVRVVNLGGGVRMELVWIPPGEFLMGSPASEAQRDGNETQHRVQMTEGFWLGRYEVTQAQWAQVMGNNPSRFQSAGPNAPVENVSWNDCQAFLKKLNAQIEKQQSELDNGVFRLPSEAEWEYACRAGTTTRFYAGEADNDLDQAGWYKDNGGGTTHPVGRKRKNPWGLYDMHGNVWELCRDWQGPYPTDEVADPTGPTWGSERIRRGGSGLDTAGSSRSARRYACGPSIRSGDIGFRVAAAR